MFTSPQAVGRSWWLSVNGLLLLAAMVSSAFAWWIVALPVVLFPDPARHADHFVHVYLHAVGGTIMLTLGAMNLFVGATRRYFRFHKFFGYTYVAAGTLASILAIVLALSNVHGSAPSTVTGQIIAASDTGIALAALGFAWLVCAAMGVYRARNARTDLHRQWMLRSYVLTWSFVLCRLIGKIPAVADLGDEPVIAWLTWLGPLLICELALLWRRASLNRAG